MRTGGLTTRMLAASVVLLAVVGTAFTVLLSAIGDLRGSTRWTEHSMGVLGASSALQNELGDYASTTRGYIDAPRRPTLEAWRTLGARLPRDSDALVRMVADNPVQTLTARAIAASIRSFEADWAEPLVALARRPGELGSAQALAQRPDGRIWMATTRSLFEHFNAREKALGLTRGKAARAHARRASIVAAAALVVLVVAIVAMALLLARTVALPVRRVARAAARLGAGELSARVPEQGQSEIGELARTFNTMATSLRDSRDELEAQNAELEAQQGELAHALERLADEKNQVDELRRFIELVSRENDPDRLAETVLIALCDYVEAPLGTLYCDDGDHGSAMTCLSALGVDAERLPEEILPGEGLAGRAIVERKILTAAFGDDGLRFESFGQTVQLAQEIHIPLVHGEQSVGVVTVGRTASRRLGPDELERVHYLAAQAAVGLSHAFALRRARNQAALNRAVLDSAHDAFVSFDERGLVTGWNPRAEAIFGWPALDAVGRDLAELIVPERDQATHRRSILRFLRGEESDLLNRRVELTARHRDGHEFPVELAISPIKLDGAWQFNAFLHDISERRLLEERSGRLFSISLDLMCTARDGRFQQINPAWSEVLGWTEEELLGTRMMDYVHPDDQETTSAIRHKLEAGVDTVSGFENRWRCADGSYRWLLWSLHLNRAENLIYAVAKDVTEGKRDERLFQARYAVSEALARSESLEDDLVGVVAAAGESLGWEFGAAWLPDDERRAMRCVGTWAAPEHDVSRFAGIVAEAELARGEGVVGIAWESAEACWIGDLAEMVGNPSFPHARCASKAGVRGGVAVPLVGADGVVSVIQLLAGEPRAEDDDTLRVLAMIGEQVGAAVERRLARREADRMKDDFLALVSHELRTPLTSIVGYLELLNDDETDGVSEHGRRFLEVIERNAIRLQRLVDDVLFAARAEAGRLALTQGVVDLRSVADESVAAARPRAEDRGVALRLDADLLPATSGDGDRLGQALDNLISNALKFTPPGGRVDLVLRKLGERAVLEVRDTGLGMSERDRERVFDRFFRAAATRDHAPGVGLGLTIVKTIVEAHGGTIEVASTEGAGTTFRIELPLERPAGRRGALNRARG